MRSLSLASTVLAALLITASLFSVTTGVQADFLGCGSAPYESEMQEKALQLYYKATGGPTKWPAHLRKNWDHPNGICAFDGDARKHGYAPYGTRCMYGGWHPPPPKGDGGVMYLNHISGFAEGELPVEFKSFFMVASLYFSDNKLRGTLWDTSKHCFLAQLNLNNNEFTGQLPDNAFAGSGVHLWGMNLADNKFSGSIPASFAKDLKAMVSFGLNDNEFTGTLPDFSEIKEIRHITVANNKLSGTLGSWVEHLENLAWLELDNNSFTGTLPHPPKTLSRFTADGNKFEGTIPESWDDDESMLRYFSCKGCDLKCPTGKENMFAHLSYSTHCRDAKKARKWAPTDPNGDGYPNYKLETFKGFY